LLVPAGFFALDFPFFGCFLLGLVRPISQKIAEIAQREREIAEIPIEKGRRRKKERKKKKKISAIFFFFFPKITSTSQQQPLKKKKTKKPSTLMAPGNLIASDLPLESSLIAKSNCFSKLWHQPTPWSAVFFFLGAS